MSGRPQLVVRPDRPGRRRWAEPRSWSIAERDMVARLANAVGPVEVVGQHRDDVALLLDRARTLSAPRAITRSAVRRAARELGLGDDVVARVAK